MTRKQTINCRGRLLLMERPLVMGILNITPDSFHDGGRFNAASSALHRAENMLVEGADIIDIGAYSSRPGAQHISEEEELQRLLPIVSAIRKEFPGAFLSIDTFRSGVANAAFVEGADIINDISGGELDAYLPSIAAINHAPFICMHMKGIPQNMQKQLVQGEMLPEVLRYFAEKLDYLKSQGLHDIIIDPGFGFGKTLEQNYELARNLPELGVFGYPILVGVSRKSMVNKLLETTPTSSLNGTTALHALLLEQGADILRVHDVKEAVEAVKIQAAMIG